MSGNIVLQIRTPLTLPPGQSSLRTFKKADGYVDPISLGTQKMKSIFPVNQEIPLTDSHWLMWNKIRR